MTQKEAPNLPPSKIKAYALAKSIAAKHGFEVRVWNHEIPVCSSFSWTRARGREGLVPVVGFTPQALQQMEEIRQHDRRMLSNSLEFLVAHEAAHLQGQEELQRRPEIKKRLGSTDVFEARAHRIATTDLLGKLGVGSITQIMERKNPARARFLEHLSDFFVLFFKLSRPNPTSMQNARKIMASSRVMNFLPKALEDSAKRKALQKISRLNASKKS